MNQTSGPARKPAEAVIKDIRGATPRHFSAAARPSCRSGHGSSARPLWIVACAITRRLPNLSTQVDQSLRSWASQIVPNHPTTGRAGIACYMPIGRYWPNGQNQTFGI
jgi:hypothetical protein